MNGMDERMNRFEERLESVSTEVGQLRGDVGGLRGEVGGLREDVHKLSVVVDAHDRHIQLIAEVQARHGRQLEEHGRLLRAISEQVAPLKDLRDFVARVADNHEQRIAALETRTGPP